MIYDRGAPGVRVTSVPAPRAPAGAPLDLRGRILGLTYEESEARVAKMTLELQNFAGDLFDRAELLGGALLEVSWGYPGNMAPPRRVVVAKLKGFQTLTVEGQGLLALWNAQAKTRRFENVTRAEVARAIAREHGYDGAFADIEETHERHDVLCQTGETDAWFLQRLAARERFRFAIDEDGVHWHARRASEAPARVLTWYADPGRGEVLSINVESDLTRRVGGVTVKARDPKAKATLEGRTTAETAERDTLGKFVEVFDGETGAFTARPWLAQESVHVSAAATPAQAKREAAARFAAAESATLVVTVQVVGDPTLRAHTVLELRGVPARLAGKYRVREAKHVLGGSGYVTDLKLARDGVGATAAPAKRQAGTPNTKEPRPESDGALREVDEFDGESGAFRRRYLASGRSPGGGDPEARKP